MINVIGQFFGTSGYAKHTRNLANALNKLEEVRLLTPLVPAWEFQVNDKELEMIKRSQKENYETNLIITHPIFWKQHLNAKQNIVYLIWEGDKIPQWIVHQCLNLKIDKIIVPSKHTAEALEKSVEGLVLESWDDNDNILDKVVLIPHGVNLDIFKPTETQKSETFTFLANKGLRNLEDRGGLQHLIKAFMEEFTDENVELILKINTAYGLPDLEKMFPGISKHKNIKIIAQDLSDEELALLYNQCDVFVSPTRAEAFNIPCLESLACGKPVITTNYGGQTDFIDITVGSLIDYELTEVQHEIEYEGVKWATPNIEDLKQKLRDYFEHSREMDYATACRKRAKLYSWKETAKQIIEIKK